MQTLLKISLILLLASFTIADKPITADCKCKGMPLYGKVREVTGSADFNVRIVNSGEDLLVDTSWQLSSKCGQWRMVSSGEDFTVRIVDGFEDFKIRIVTFSSGLPNH